MSSLLRAGMQGAAARWVRRHLLKALGLPDSSYQTPDHRDERHGIQHVCPPPEAAGGRHPALQRAQLGAPHCGRCNCTCTGTSLEGVSLLMCGFARVNALNAGFVAAYSMCPTSRLAGARSLQGPSSVPWKAVGADKPAQARFRCSALFGALTACLIRVFLRPGRHPVATAPGAAAAKEPHDASDGGVHPAVHREAAGCCELEGCAGRDEGEQHIIQGVPRKQCGPCAPRKAPSHIACSQQGPGRLISSGLQWCSCGRHASLVLAAGSYRVIHAA